MKYIKHFENFKPIKVNNEKPFKIKKNILKSIIYLQKGIKSDTKRIQKEKNVSKRNKLTQDRNSKMLKIKDLMRHKAKQIQYLRDNPIEESVKNKKTLLELLESESFKPKDIVNYIGFEGEDYEIATEKNWDTYEDIPSYDEEGITFYIDNEKLENEIGLNDIGIFNFLLSFNGYNNYEYYVDDEELHYLHHYINDNLKTKIKKLSKIFKYEINVNEEGKISDLFYKLGLESKLEDFKNEIAMENERAIEKAANALLKSLPYDIDNNFGYNKNFNLELTFNYKDIIEYIKKYNIEEVETIKEFMENVSENDDLSYEFEYEMKYDYLGDFKDLTREIENIVDDFVNNPDKVILYIVKSDNLKMFKKNIDLAFFSYKYNIHIDYSIKKLNIFELAKKINKDILQYMKSKEFEKIINNIGGEDLESYNEMIFGEDINAFNL